MPIDSALEDPNEDEDLMDPNDRRPMRLLDARRQADGELSDSDDEGEGGRRNHARYRDRDSHEPNGTTHKFGLGGGILSSGPMNTHGAGPSGHTNAIRILTSTNQESSMDVDTPSTESNTAGSGTEAPAGIAPAPSSPADVDPSPKIEPEVEAKLPAPAEKVDEKPTDDKMVVDPVDSESEPPKAV